MSATAESAEAGDRDNVMDRVGIGRIGRGRTERQRAGAFPFLPKYVGEWS